MFGWTIALIDRLFAVCGALLFSQIPQFMHQYLQRLSGHVSELQKQVTLMNSAADRSHLSLLDYVSKFANAGNPVFESQGQLMTDMLIRFRQLQEALSELATAPLWGKPWAFFSHLEFHIARDTFETFQPGIPTTLEGVVYAFIGMLVGMAIFKVIKTIVSKPFQKNPKISPAAQQ